VTTEVISISVGGAPFLLWDDVRVHGGVKHAARTMEMSFPDTPGAPIWPAIFSGQPIITVTASPGSDVGGGGGGGDLLFTGNVEKRHVELEANSLRVTISARSKGADAIDSSVDHTKPDYVKSNVLKVAQDQDAFGIGFIADFMPVGFDRWRPNVGHTLFAALAPLCEDENATMSGQPDGSIKITQAGATAKAQGAPLVEGSNWHIKGSADFDDSNQHSKVKAHGQNYKGDGQQAIAIYGEADNDTVTRYRPLHEHHDRQTDKPRLTKRATRRRDKEQGEGTRASAELKTFRDDSGMLWAPGNKVFAISPSLALSQYMLIESVLYSQTGQASSGTRCALSLVDPRAHGGQGGGVNKSGSEWGFDSSQGD
jgi:prophage tail gpP-like protein